MIGNDLRKIDARIEMNHEKQHALFLSGVDCSEQCDVFTYNELNNFIEFLEEQRGILNKRDAQQKWLFGRKEHFEVKDENDASKKD